MPWMLFETPSAGPADSAPAPTPRLARAAALLLLAAAIAGCKAHIPASTPIDASVQANQPSAYADLCRRHANLCEVPEKPAADAPIVLDETTFAALDEVNYEVNRAIRYRSDREVYGRRDFWTVADAGDAGDCEDFALAKLERLLARGFPREAMRLAVVHRPRDGVRHAVLTVDTDRGTYVLDSSYSRVMAWDDLPYTNWARERPGRQRWDVRIGAASRTAALR
jgi:predicted transglutaminase-like cysteine proteinase